MPPVRRRKELNDRETDRMFIWERQWISGMKQETVGLGLGDISDAAFSKILLDRLVIYNLSASIIFILSRISNRITKWSMLC